MQVRLDGKAIRGAKDADGNQVRLLAALAGPDAASSVVAAQAEVGKKTNEVPMATVVLGQIDLDNKIVTADALHTVKATASHIHEHGGEFVLPVKENRQALFDALDALPWSQVPVAHTAADKGHALDLKEITGDRQDQHRTSYLNYCSLGRRSIVSTDVETRWRAHGRRE